MAEDKPEAQVDAPVKMKRHRLLHRAYMDGAVQEPGYIFALPEDVLGPHRTVNHGGDKIDLTIGSDQNGQHIPARVTDVPLYETLDDEEEIAPTVERSGDVKHLELQAAGGAQHVGEVQGERATNEARLRHLNERDGDLSDDEVKERDRLRADFEDPHLAEHDPAHAGQATSDAAWVGDKPPATNDQGNPAHHEPPLPTPDGDRFREPLKDKSVSEPEDRPLAQEAHANADDPHAVENAPVLGPSTLNEKPGKDFNTPETSDPAKRAAGMVGDEAPQKQPGLNKTDAAVKAGKDRPLASLSEKEHGIGED